MSIVQETSQALPKHRVNRRVSIRKYLSKKTDGNFTYGAIVGIIAYMVLSVVWRLAEAIIF